MSIEIQICRSDFETAAYSSMRSLFLALAFLTPDSVRHAFQEIKPFLPPAPEDLVLYFEQTYIGQYSNADTGTDALRPLRLTWRESPFPPSIWSVYESSRERA